MTAEAKIAAQLKDHQDRMDAQVGAMIDGQPVLVRDLRIAFDEVCDKEHWKNPIAVYVPAKAVRIVIEAIKFFQADNPVCEGIEPITGRVLVTSRGYQAW